MKVTGELHNWEYDHQLNIFYGDIYCDEKRRWLDGKRIRTSTVLTINHVGGSDDIIVVTLNSSYRLNKEQQRKKPCRTSEQ